MKHLLKNIFQEGYSLNTLCSGGLKKIVLAHNQKGSINLTGFEKVDNPVYAIHGDFLFAVWEFYGEKTQLSFTQIDLNGEINGINTLRVCQRWLSHHNEYSCYRPRLVSNGKDLLLCYEQFIGGEYKIMGRFWQQDNFSSPHELAGDRGNNQEPWLEALDSSCRETASELSDKPLVDQNGFLLSYENSQPLYKDYVWISPSGDKVIIPGFGHGWRVETKSYLKRITLSGSDLYFATLGGEGHILINEEESSGCPRVLPLSDNLSDNLSSTPGCSALAVVFCAMGDHIWTLRYALFDGRRWSDSVDTGLKQERRVTPQAWYDRESKTLRIKSLFSPEGEPQTKEISLLSFLLKAEEKHLTPTNQSTVFSRPLPCATPVFMPEERAVREIEYQGGSLKLLWGDLHMHSNISKCSLHSKFHCVELEEKFRQSADVGRLDFAMITDHDSMTNEEWDRTRSQAEFHNRPGIFTAFQGFEWTATHGPGPKQGHYNVLYRDRGRLYRVSEEDGSHITKLWEDMTPGEVLTIPHHPADETHTLDWQFFDPRFEPLVEIFQVRGSYEYPGNSLDPSLFREEKMVPGASLLEALEKGYEFGFTSGGEHEGVGTTAVYSLDNTREAIFDALKKRQVYGTTGDHIFMDFRVNGVLMGGEIHGLKNNPEISIIINGTAPIKELRLMRDGKKIYSESFDSCHVNLNWTDHDFILIREERKTHYYYLAVEQLNGESGWASPIFIKRTGDKL